MVSTISGNKLDLTGTWKACCYDIAGNRNIAVTAVFSALTASVVFDSHLASDMACTGTATFMASESDSILVSTKVGSLAYYWADIDPTIIGMPPFTQNFGPDLFTSSAVTLLISTITASSNPADIGQVFQDAYIIDDTVPATPVLYMTAYIDPNSLIVTGLASFALFRQ